MILTCNAFQNGSPIPQRFTCEGENISPEISWSEAPADAKSFVLVVHDPDAPREGGFTHWVLYKIPGTTDRIPERVPKNSSLPGLGMQARNDSGKVGYMGPCPPTGSHRYFFRLYALRSNLDLQPGETPANVRAAMNDKIIEEAELMGTYEKVGSKAA
jgi:hypothetical protein